MYFEKWILIIFLFFFLFTCKDVKKEEKSDIKVKGIVEQKDNYDKYEDLYKDFEYYNKKLGLKIIFDSEWSVTVLYKDFDSMQKKYARYFSSQLSELLFVGADDQRKIGVRCTCEILGLSNDEYLSLIKSSSQNDITNYKISITEEKVTLKNLEGINLISEVKVNSKNIFVFDTLIFKNENRNYRLDFWITKKKFDLYKDYIYSLFQTIDFVTDKN